MANTRAATFRKAVRGEESNLFLEPRNQMQDKYDVWFRLLGTKGYLAYIHMTTEEALSLAFEILRNVSHRHDVEEAIEILARRNGNAIIESMYQKGLGELFEAIAGKGAEVININDKNGDDDVS